MIYFNKVSMCNGLIMNRIQFVLFVSLVFSQIFTENDTWMKPNNATILVIGDVTMDELKDKLGKSLKKWKKEMYR